MKNERSERRPSGSGKTCPTGFGTRRQRPHARQEHELPTAAANAARPEGTGTRRQRPDARQEHETPTAAANATQPEGTGYQRPKPHEAGRPAERRPASSAELSPRCAVPAHAAHQAVGRLRTAFRQRGIASLARANPVDRLRVQRPRLRAHRPLGRLHSPFGEGRIEEIRGHSPFGRGQRPRLRRHQTLSGGHPPLGRGHRLRRSGRLGQLAVCVERK